MPSRGYRKGISDAKEPRPHVLKTRTGNATRQALDAECDARSLTLSALIATILDAHVAGARPELPHARMSSAAVRELCRLGNNLNQLAHVANLMHLHLVETDARQCLRAVPS